MTTGDDVMVRLPPPLGALTYDEWHALLLGVAPGTTAALGLLAGLYEPVFYLTLTILVPTGLVGATSLERLTGARITDPDELEAAVPTKNPAKAVAVLASEPWYFLASYLLSAAGLYGASQLPALVGALTWL